MATAGDSRLRAVSGGSVIIAADDDIATLVRQLGDLNLATWSAFESDLAYSGCLQQLRYILKDDGRTPNPQDSFRRTQGFQAIVKTVQCLSLVWWEAANAGKSNDAIQALTQILTVLEAALAQHPGNKRFFRVKIEHGGWTCIQDSLSNIIVQITKQNDSSHTVDRFFGALVAAAVGCETISDIFLFFSKICSSIASPQSFESEIQKALRPVSDLVVPELLTGAVKLWSQHLSKQSSSSLTTGVPLTVKSILSISRQNLIAAHTSGLLSVVIPLLYDATDISDHEKSILREVVLQLCKEGVPSIHDARYIFSKASSNSTAASLLLDIINASRKPPSIQFDLSHHGSSAIELANLRRPFPPSEAAGYSISMWINIDHFDDRAHTTLFGVFDRSQTCFVLAYLEKDTKYLILQTSMRGSKPSVRFKSTYFHTGRWYHICLTHRKPKAMSSSKASLFVNGEFVEQIKATFPAHAPVDRASGIVKVQAFIGTPQDLSPQVSGVPCTSRWSLANAILLEDLLSDDLISVIYHLGPEYYGNFQDCLGSFQTYQASTALNLRNESLNPGREEKSDLVLAIRHKGSQILNERRIIINVAANAVLDNDDRWHNVDVTLLRSLSKVAARNLAAYTRSGLNAIVVNGAVPAINDALVQTNGVAMLMGGPLVAAPQSLDEASWRLGGCAAIGLTLIQKARTTEDVDVTVKAFLNLIKDNWRNSEAVERLSGYGILSNLIREKLSSSPDIHRGSAAIPTRALDKASLGLRLLKTVLLFVGYNDSDETKCLLENPMAYKVLLVDSNIWRTHSADTRCLFFKQITAFALTSYHSRFNLKRLNRMRMAKRLIEALKSDAITKAAMPLYLTAIEALLPSAMSPEMLRSISLFVTYAVHKRSNNHRPRKSQLSDAKARESSSTSENGAGRVPDDSVLTSFEVGTEVLRLYSNLLCKNGDTVFITKFASTVTNKWLLYLLSESSPEVIVTSTKILARLLVVHGSAYVKKFKEKSGGFTIMSHRLKRWWHLPALWPICFAILFGVDVAQLKLNRSFDLFSFIEVFDSQENYRVAYPEIFEVITAMLQSGLRTISSSKPGHFVGKLAVPNDGSNSGTQSPQRLSMSTMAPPNPFSTLATPEHVETFSVVIRFLADLQSRSQKFREFAMTSTYIQDLLQVLFPVVVGADIVEATTELNARDSVLSFEGMDVVIQPLSSFNAMVKSATEEPATSRSRGKMLRRGSSFVMVSREQIRQSRSATRLRQQSPSGSTISRLSELKTENSEIVQSILELIVSISIEQVLSRREFPGLGLFLKTPPGFVEHQHYFESWILRNIVSQLSSAISLNQRALCEPKVLTNLTRFFTHLGEALYEGWFVGGVESALDLAGSVLEYLQRPDVAQIKTVRLCAHLISTIRIVILRIIILSLSQAEGHDLVQFIGKLSYWQNVILLSDDAVNIYLQHICFLLYGCLVSTDDKARSAASNLWRIILVQKPKDVANMLGQANSPGQQQTASGFEKLVEMDNESFLIWVDDHKAELDALFSALLSRSWDAFVSDENSRTEEAARARIRRRREKLKTLAREEAGRESLLQRHEATFLHWTSNIYSSEHLKYQRLMQDQQDDRSFTDTAFRQMQHQLSRSTGLFADGVPVNWRLDQTEGRSRMRMRLIEDFKKGQEVAHRSKKRGSEIPVLKLDTKTLRIAVSDSLSVDSATEPSSATSIQQIDGTAEPFPEIADPSIEDENGDIEDSFEVIENPNEQKDEFEDKNRKVMRSLQRGDQVKTVANISRIVGLEAVEGLLILGQNYIYLLDNFFQRADGEIVNVWQAPQSERDPYVRVISGRDLTVRKPSSQMDHEARSWKWSDIISVSKRRFLFRDVAIEIFFADGRSYLVTMMSTATRNDLYTRINSKTTQYGNDDCPESENVWRYDTLKSAEEEPSSFSTRFGNLFTQASGLTATRKWQKGEMSNFHYLMLINTLAGRTYNDLTQYPVFPWIIADYTSSELDLNNPKTFRDLSKPMGCQTQVREEEFKDRYKSFAEMGDHLAPPFHYGTHYSSAMIVTSYLIRLQPFVESYLLLQGGTFDHADRMFFSIEQAWRSASRVNMTDVRELTPEFYYLTEFLTNPNGFDFGTRQNSKKSISEVELPPWAKGEPRIFIAKQREALESPYVSAHLHKWIDLIFGHKQKGEAAIEAVNVFHHLSYQGAKDLDAIADPVERLATIGIIHNFGQTPYQIFTRPHPTRESAQHRHKRIDTAAESLTRLPSTLLNSSERIASLNYSQRADKLLCSGAFRLNMPPNFDKYMEWGFFDHSIRFYMADSRRQIALFEHLHIGQLSCALFGDLKTLITASTDCTIAVWSIISDSKNVDLQPRQTLFGHNHPVIHLSVSKSLNALLSASACGEIILWDLSRCEFVRRISLLNLTSTHKKPIHIDCTAINDVTGNIVLCHNAQVSIYSINGDLLLSQNISDHALPFTIDDPILSVACYEGVGTEWLERDIVFTGHRRGVVKVWNVIVNSHKRAGSSDAQDYNDKNDPVPPPFELGLIRQLNHVDPARDDGGNVAAGISCIYVMPQVVYTGDEDGRVCEWNCVQRH